MDGCAFPPRIYAVERSMSPFVADNICRRPVPGECLGNLVCQPLRRRMPSHRKPQQLPPAVAEHKKSEELLKRNRRNHKEINRRNPVGVVMKEGLPRLRRSTSPRYQYFETVDWATSKPSFRSSP